MSYPMPEAYDEALKAGDHEGIVRVAVLVGGAEAATTEAIATTSLEMLPGAGVKVARNQDVRRSFQWSVVDPEGALVPLTAGDLLDPLSFHEVQVWRGIRTAAGAEWLVPVAVVGMDTAKIEATAEGIVMDLAGRDRMAPLTTTDYDEPYVIVAGTAVETAVGELAQALHPLGAQLPLNLPITGETVPDRLVFEPGKSKPARDLQRLADLAAMEVLFDPVGALTMRDYPDPAVDDPAWKYLRNSENLRVAPLVRTVDASTARNGVVVRGEAPWLLFPVVGEAYDEDPTSPTWWQRIGKRPERIGDSLVGSQAAATALAEAKLPSVLGIEEQVTLAALVNAALDVADVIELEHDLFGGIARLALDTLDVPLDVEDRQQLGGRRRRV